MFLNSWRIRLGMIGAGVVLAIAWVMCGGSLFPSSQGKILIEFGANPDGFAGCDVEIDGRIAGKLERFGQATRTAFPVDPGTHQVRVVDPQFDSTPVPIEAPGGGMSTMVLLEMGDVPGPSGKPQVVLRP
jgi:K+-transporting ATPase A subunit